MGIDTRAARLAVRERINRSVHRLFSIPDAGMLLRITSVTRNSLSTQSCQSIVNRALASERKAAVMKESFVGLISGTRGKGPSSTRLVYLINGVAAAFCAIVATIGGTIVYCWRSEADAVYWTGVAAMWTASLGFGAK